MNCFFFLSCANSVGNFDVFLLNKSMIGYHRMNCYCNGTLITRSNISRSCITWFFYYYRYLQKNLWEYDDDVINFPLFSNFYVFSMRFRIFSLCCRFYCVFFNRAVWISYVAIGKICTRSYKCKKSWVFMYLA